ncbi:MAG TPA: methylated-DNA--[protein]-cysteine S-methyltransferase [Streptosporangiaceae bacterium]|jgi:methylated-DNA-[protein]-cysteine S-methyltransferase
MHGPAQFVTADATTRVYDIVGSPIGGLALIGDGTVLTGLYMETDHARVLADPELTRAPGAFPEAADQLDAYFSGERTTFDLPLAPRGTEFQRAVWSALTEIPYGQTTTYAQLALDIDRPTAIRAVGAANGRNPISLIIPCHRVIGTDGSLTGYAGGLPRKRTLLDLESGTHMLT